MSDELLGELLVKIGMKKDTNLNTVLGEVKDEVGKTVGSITDAGSKAALAFSAIGMSGLVITKGWIDAAAKMEQYKATLTAVMHSQDAASAKLKQMVKFAADTPFQIPEVVEAGVQIKALGQDIDTFLPLAGDLAAVFGRTIPEASLALAKAASGSQDGVQVLADAYGISRQKMIQYGAATDGTGGIMVKTGQQAEQLRGALIRIVRTEYGGAMAVQMGTLVGAFSNFGDAVGRISSSLGAELSPFIISVTRSITDMLGVWDMVPGPIKQVIAFGTLAGSVFTLVAGGALGAGVAANLAATQIIELGAALGIEAGVSAVAAEAAVDHAIATAAEASAVADTAAVVTGETMAKEILITISQGVIASVARQVMAYEALSGAVFEATAMLVGHSRSLLALEAQAGVIATGASAHALALTGQATSAALAVPATMALATASEAQAAASAESAVATGAQAVAMEAEAVAAGQAAVASAAAANKFGQAWSVAGTIGTRAVSAMASSLVAFVTGPVGIALASVAVVWAAVKTISSWEESYKTGGRALQEQSSQLQTAAEGWRHYRDAINSAAAAHGKIITDGRKVAVVLQDVNDVLGNMGQVDAAQAMAKMGLSPEGAKQELERLKQQREDLVARKQLMEDVQNNGLRGKSSEDREKVLKTLGVSESGVVGATDIEASKKAGEALAGMDLTMDNLQKKIGLIVHAQQQVLNPLTETLGEVSKRSAAIKDYLDFSEKLGTLTAYNDRLQVLNKALEDTRSLVSARGIPTDEAGLLAFLRNPNITKEQRQLAEAYATLSVQKRETEEKIRTEAVKTHQEVLKSDTDLAKGRKEQAQAVLEEHQRTGKATLADHAAVSRAAIAIAKYEKASKLQELKDQEAEAQRNGQMTAEKTQYFTKQRALADQQYNTAKKQADEQLAQSEKELQQQRLGFHKDVLSARSAGMDLELQRLQMLQSRGIDVEKSVQAKQQQRLQMAIDLHNVETRLATGNAKSPEERAAIERKASLEEGNIRQRFYQEEYSRQYERWKTQHDFSESTLLDEKKLAVEVAKTSHDTVGIRIAEARSREALIQKAVEDARNQGQSEVEIARRVSLMRKQFLLEDQKARQQAFEAMEEEIIRVTQGDLAAEILRIQRQAQTYREQTGPEGDAKVSQWLAAKKQDLLKKEADALGKVGEAADKSADSVDKLNKSFERLGGANSPLLSLEEMAAGMSIFSSHVTATAAGVGRSSATSTQAPVGASAPAASTSSAAVPSASTFPSNTERINAGLSGAGAGSAGSDMASSVISQIDAAMNRPGISEGEKARLREQKADWLAKGKSDAGQWSGPRPGTRDVSGIMSDLAGLDPTSPVARALMARAGLREALGGLSGLPTVPSKGALAATVGGSSASPGVSATVNPASAAGTPSTSSSTTVNTTNTLNITVNGQQVSGDVKDPAQLRKGLGHCFGAAGLERFADTGGR